MLLTMAMGSIVHACSAAVEYILFRCESIHTYIDTLAAASLHYRKCQFKGGGGGNNAGYSRP